MKKIAEDSSFFIHSLTIFIMKTFTFYYYFLFFSSIDQLAFLSFHIPLSIWISYMYGFESVFYYLHFYKRNNNIHIRTAAADGGGYKQNVFILKFVYTCNRRGNFFKKNFKEENLKKKIYFLFICILFKFKMHKHTHTYMYINANIRENKYAHEVNN